MGLVSEAIITQVREQLKQHGTVVWYDPEKTNDTESVYARLVGSLTPEQIGAPIYRYRPEDGFFWLRRDLEPIWSAARDKAPALLIYVPQAQHDCAHALVEFEVAGAVLQPNQQPPERDTSLAAVTRYALDPIFPEARLDEIVRDAASGKFSLSELDGVAERGAEAQTGTISVIFGTGNAGEVALAFLASADRDDDIAARDAVGAISAALGDLLGITFDPSLDVAQLRAMAARQVLMTDLLVALGEKAPAALKTVRLADQSAARQAACRLASTWRNQRDTAESYVDWANKIEGEVSLSRHSIPGDALAQTETFAAGESYLQTLVEQDLRLKPTLDLVELAETRLAKGFWSSQSPEIKMRWQLIDDAGRVLLEAARIENALRGKTWSAGKLFSEYALGDVPWCSLDTAHRHMEHHRHLFDLDHDRHKFLHQLVSNARERYTAVTNRLAEAFTKAFEQEQFSLPDVLLQADIFRDVVSPVLKSKRVAYVLVDAFRFEMARELMDSIPGFGVDWGVEIVPALGTPPTVTEVGMAALMPGAEQGITLKQSKDTLIPHLGDKSVKSRQDRVKLFRAVVGEGCAVVKLDQLAPLDDEKLRRTLKSSPSVLMTATEEIDGIGENNPKAARKMINEVFEQLRRALTNLFNLGFNTAIISADHGFIFGEALESGQKIDAPGGKPAKLTRRVWVGKGGASDPALLRAPLSAFGIGGDLELVTPYGLACFKVQGGNNEYFHGGLSLQEVVIPVLTVIPQGVPTVAGGVGDFEWTITLGSKIIATQFFSVTVEGAGKGLLSEPPTVRVELRDGDQPISVPVSSTYGFQEGTKDVRLALSENQIEKNTIALQVTEKPKGQRVSVVLIDASTGVSLKRLDDIPAKLDLTFD